MDLSKLHDYFTFNDTIENVENYINRNIILDGSKLYIRRINIGNIVICEVAYNWNYLIQNSEEEILLYTGCKELVTLNYEKMYRIEVEGNIKKVWLGEIVEWNEYFDIKINLNNNLKCTQSINARCEESMEIFDSIHRNFINKYKFKNNDIMAIKSVAGSGKTTSLLKLSKIHKDKKILYLAFNKNLIEEIKDKIYDQNIKNLEPRTFDSLIRQIFILQNNFEPNIISLRPQNIGEFIPYLSDKYYNVKNCYVKGINKFCNQIEFTNPKEFANKVLKKNNGLIEEIWQKMLDHEIITFDSMRKFVEMNNWTKNIIDEKYDMIFIDEAQDFDNVMLKILLEDTTIPKLFVGDSKQAIYEWKGSINAFEKLPKSALILEFYSTFRIGNPACKEISDKFNDCWMISKSKNKTYIYHDIEINDNYVYLFRSWKKLLQTARNINDIWIYSYDKQVKLIRNLHEKMSKSKRKLSKDELNQFGDDLPYFLQKLTKEDLNELLEDIDNNIVDFDDAVCKMYTIHSYKGLEHDIIKIADDIDIKKEENIYYVALTRGMKQIIEDKVIMKIDTTLNNVQNIDDMTFEELFSEINKDLLEELEIYRKQTALKIKKPSYCIFKNSVLRDISIKIPKTKEELLKINGIGEGKLNHYGNDILFITNKY
tara:strand:- start:3276 stop:5237 length:1962 start_codon:yes stop_codon:yes gene_type:complete